MKKIIALFAFFVLVVSSFTINSAMAVYSSYEVEESIAKLERLAYDDYFSMINKSELIGVRYDNFNMQTMQYKSDISNIIGIFKEKLNKIEIINNSTDYSDTEKQMQLNNIYQEINSLLNSIDMKTLNYLNNLGMFMPSITYQRYYRDFVEYYNGLGITNYQIQLKR